MEVEAYLSALCDGEDVPLAAAQHVVMCEACRRIFNDYSTMGAELRLAAALQFEQLPPFTLPSPGKSLRFLWARVAVPRLAVAALVACSVLAMVVASSVRAQSRPLWFEFAYGLDGSPQFNYKIARSGYDDTGAVSSSIHGSPGGAAVRIQIESISADDVALRVRAVPPKFKVNPTDFTVIADPDHPILLDKTAPIHYRPGESLTIPIEGGGTLYLRGEVLDHQPKIAFGVPLEPPVGELIIRSPILIASDQLLSEFQGVTAIAENDNYAVNLCPDSNGTFVFALKPFPGAIQGEANWGELTFELEGRSYRMVTAAPMTAGEQPQPVWVRHDLASDLGTSGASVGVRRIP